MCMWPRHSGVETRESSGNSDLDLFERIKKLQLKVYNQQR